MVLGVRAAQLGLRKQVAIFLILTLILGFAFLGERGYQFIAYYDADRRITVAGRKVGDPGWARLRPAGVPLPALMQIIGSQPTALQKSMNSSVPKRFVSTPPQA